MSDETKPGETAEIDSNTSKADLKAAADDILKSAPKQEDAPEAQADVDPVQQLEIEKEELREQLLRTLSVRLLMPASTPSRNLPATCSAFRITSPAPSPP